jgi:hypothetical protein
MLEENKLTVNCQDAGCLKKIVNGSWKRAEQAQRK